MTTKSPYLDLFNSQMSDVLFSTIGNLAQKTISYSLLEKIIDLIMDGTLKPGYTFPNENEMCKRLKVGRSTLREAYAALNAMGFISRNKAGTVVNGTHQIVKSLPLNYMFKKSEFQDIYEFRSMLETQCAQVASLRATEETIRKLSGIIEEMRVKGAENDIRALTELDQRFHFEIASSCGNQLIKNTLTAVTNEYEQTAYLGYCLDQSVIEHSIDFHQQIFEAIRDRDPELARFKMQAHIKNIYWVLENFIFKNGNVNLTGELNNSNDFQDN